MGQSGHNDKKTKKTVQEDDKDTLMILPRLPEIGKIMVAKIEANQFEVNECRLRRDDKREVQTECKTEPRYVTLVTLCALLAPQRRKKVRRPTGARPMFVRSYLSKN